MALIIGTQLGPYEITALLGQGGMGEVYRARDTRLGRIVAIKVLADHMADRADVRERFEREARAIAGLNHPHICVLYDIGRQDNIDYLVMEYLEGETLARRLEKGPLPVDQVLRHAVEIADALDKAHRNGITHRDLKPGNIMLTKSGAKLLDFGLAKLRQDASPATSLSQVPTMHTAATSTGTIAGTVQYMAPEQLEGNDVDARTDIFAFGLVVYEMALARKAFEGKTTAAVIAKTLESEAPAMSSMQPAIPRELDRIVKTCLAKDPDERWQNAADLKRELKWIGSAAHAETSAARSAAAPIGKTKREWFLWAVSAVLLVAALAIATIHFTEQPPPTSPRLQFHVRLPDKVSFTRSSPMELSPDGRSVAFIATGPDTQAHIWVQNLDGEARVLANTDVGVNAPPPFWSPDGRFLVYSGFTKIRKVDVLNGAVQDLCDKPGPMVGGSWNADGVIIFGSNITGLWRTTATGGKPVPLTVLDASMNEREHELPQFLPDGIHFLYLRVSDQPERTGIYVGSLNDAPEQQSKQRILETGFGVRFVPSPDGKAGTLLSFRDGTVTAHSFDLTTLQVQGELGTVAEGVGSAYQTPQFAAVANLMVYRLTPPPSPYQFTWVDDQGKRGDTVGNALEELGTPALSPDGTRLAYSRAASKGENEDIWVLDVTRDLNMRFTFGQGDNSVPIWSADGRDIIFSSNRDGGVYSLYRKPADGSQQEELLLKTPTNAFATNPSQDGQFLVYQTAQSTGSVGDNLWMVPLKGERKPVRMSSTDFDEFSGRVSPDGRWMAYVSNETGRYEVYVREFMPGVNPAAGGKWIVSRDGGYWPMWRKDGKELRFVSTDGSTVMSVIVDSARTFLAAAPKPVFRLPAERLRLPYTGLIAIANTADLKRFLVPLPVEQPLPPAFMVLVNWKSGMKSKSR